MKKYNIRTEQPRDFKIVENLTREAFITGTTLALSRNSRSSWKLTDKLSDT